MLRVHTPLPMPGYATVQRRAQFYTQVVDGVRALPGVSDAAYITGLPMVMGGGIWPVGIDGRAIVRDGANTASFRMVTPRLLLDDADSAPARPRRRGDGRYNARPRRRRERVVREALLAERGSDRQDGSTLRSAIAPSRRRGRHSRARAGATRASRRSTSRTAKSPTARSSTTRRRISSFARSLAPGTLLPGDSADRASGRSDAADLERGDDGGVVREPDGVAPRAAARARDSRVHRALACRRSGCTGCCRSRCRAARGRSAFVWRSAPSRPGSCA